VKQAVGSSRSGIIERYRAYLPVTEKTPIITLHEGDTPLIPAQYLADHLGIKVQIYFKYEGLNPTGSFKDRGMTMAVSKAVERDSKAILCASTGNTSASAAAYAARAGIQCAVLIPEGKIALGKLAQALMHGARVIQIKGNFDEALTLARDISQSHPITLVNSVNPDRMEGQKTAAFEIMDTLGEAPTLHCIPVGNAANIAAYWKGYKEYQSHGKTSILPRMWGFQASGAAPIVRGKIVEKPETLATAIRIGNPASWKSALSAVEESHGMFDEVTDDDILESYRFLASREGLFAEPASAASVAGLKKCAKKGLLKAGQTIVCTLTGHGLKDPDTATKIHAVSTPIAPEKNAVLKAIGL
jgi:threonine synthase